MTAYAHLKLYEKYHALQSSLTYGEILSFSDAIEKRFMRLNYWEKRAAKILQASPIAKEILNIVETENARREQVLADDRGPAS